MSIRNNESKFEIYKKRKSINWYKPLGGKDTTHYRPWDFLTLLCHIP